MSGLYLHLPFCAVKCAYCDFAAFSGQNAKIDAYLSAIEKDLDSQLARQESLGAANEIETLYIGGGTPTELSADQLSRLLDAVEARFGPIANLREATCEANPETATRDRLSVLVERGIGRLSLGLQAKQDRLLKALNRLHDWNRFEEAFLDARRAGFDNVNVDLMLGLPGQSAADVEESLSALLAFKPEHLSVYALQVEERTQLHRRMREGRFSAKEDLESEMYEQVRLRLASAGFRQYEISNFARPGYESEHNRLYWNRRPCFAAGCGASGFLDGRRWTNVWKLDDYLEAVEKTGRGESEAETLQGREALGEELYLGLRMLEGFRLTPNHREAFRRSFERLRSEGLVEVLESQGRAPRARLTERGLFLSNRVFREFV